MAWSRFSKVFGAVSAMLLAAGAGAHTKLAERRMEHINRRAVMHAERQAGPANASTAGFQFLNSATKPYQVTSLPEVNYPLGEVYSGLTPIDTKNTSRELFWIFQPTLGKPVDEIVIWLNGGPGCSSLEGFFQENGRFTWIPGTFKPIENYYSWVNISNILWVEQPVGTGFSIGEVTATSEEEIAEDFVKFFKNWQDLFGIKNYKIYVTGESYAGRYVPYISAAMIDQNNTENYNLSGALTYDPCIGDFTFAQEEVVAYPFVRNFDQVFNYNETFLAQMESLHESCGYADYIDKYLSYPPPGIQPPRFFNYSDDNDLKCDVFNDLINAALTVNPCWNLYHITDQCEIPDDVLGFPTLMMEFNPPRHQAYFNRTDVKKALHAPLDVDWALCSVDPVFIGGVNGTGGPQAEGDLSADPIQKVLPKVIEHTNRVLIGNGDLDMVIITNGTLLAIQNMTWNGKLGFQEKPTTPIDILLPDLQYQDVLAANGFGGLDDTQGVMGIQHYERGLMWVETYLSGHQQPQYQPRSTYRHLEWLLGRIQTI